MMTSTGDAVTFYLIDIGRALIDRVQGTKNPMRFKDLNRICYKLDWSGREALIRAYYEKMQQPMPKWWRLSLASYDWKQRSKKMLRGKIK